MNPKRFLVAAIVCLASTLVFMAGCNNVCEGVACNNGECADGECVCFDGYEGDNCEFTANAKFSGTYMFSRVCDSSRYAAFDTLTLQPVSGSTDAFKLEGLDGVTVLDARVLADGVEFVIQRQSIGGGKELESISGTISTDANTINLNYQVLEGQTDVVYERCSGSMVK